MNFSSVIRHPADAPQKKFQRFLGKNSCGMPGFNGNMHGADEHLCVKDLLTACKIFTQVIVDLCV